MCADVAALPNSLRPRLTWYHGLAVFSTVATTLRPPVGGSGDRPDPALPVGRAPRARWCDECDPEEMLRYTRDGWPKCCREVMTLFTPTDMTELTRTIGQNAADPR